MVVSSVSRSRRDQAAGVFRRLDSRTLHTETIQARHRFSPLGVSGCAETHTTSVLCRAGKRSTDPWGISTDNRTCPLIQAQEILPFAFSTFQEDTGINLAAVFYHQRFVHARKGDYDLAIEDYDQAIRLKFPAGYRMQSGVSFAKRLTLFGSMTIYETG